MAKTQIQRAHIVADLISRIYLTEEKVGFYCTHVINKKVIVATSTGILNLPLPLLQKQLRKPASITEDEIMTVIATFKV